MANFFLDACGLYCPEPVMLLHKKVREMQTEDLLYVRATDPSTQRDIPKFCQFLGHQLIAQEKVQENEQDIFLYTLQKG
jgi:tRNA 2-thiouridine synthesizing protein A